MIINGIYFDDFVYYFCLFLISLGAYYLVSLLFKFIKKDDPIKLITSIVIVLTVVGIGLYLKTDSNYQDMFNYVGSIVGGFLTLFGVWLTINYESKNKEKELKEEYKPILQITVGQKLITYEDNKTYLRLIIENNGLGNGIILKNTLIIYCPDININNAIEMDNIITTKKPIIFDIPIENLSKKVKNTTLYLFIKYTDTFSKSKYETESIINIFFAEENKVSTTTNNILKEIK